MSMIVCADAYEWIALNGETKAFHVDHVITDYPYGTVFPLDDLLDFVRGNIMTFCAQEDFPFMPSERAYWIKTPSTKNTKGSKKLSRFVEPIFIYRQGDTFNTDLHWSNYTGVYTDLVESASGHQWQKPASLMERLVRIYTNPGDVVLDPFCGSGATLKACRKLGRPCIGIDNNPEWVNFCRREDKDA